MSRAPLRARIVSVVVLRGAAADAEVLLMRRTGSNAGTWCQVAGKVEPGETAWQAGLRELREETGLAPETYWSADFVERFYEPARDAVALVPVFLARVPPGAEPVLDAEHDAHVWLRLADAIARVSFGGQREMLAWIGREFLDRTPSAHLRIAT